MSLQVKTTQELSDLIISQLETKLSQTIPFLPGNAYRVLAKVLSGVFIILYKYGGFIFLNMFVQYAGTEVTTINGQKVIPLVEWGRLVGLKDPAAATRFEGVIDITVTQTGGTLAANTQLTRLTTGVTYLTLADVALSASTVQADIRAYSDQQGTGGRGTQGNLVVGDKVSFVNPQSDVKSVATVASVTTTAADAESWEVYRQKVIDRFRKPPQGGAPVDYELWGEETEGIVNVYPYKGNPGQVNVYSEATPESSGDPDGIPTTAQLDAVKESIEQNESGLATRRPISSFVNSYPITRPSYNVNVVDIYVNEPDKVVTKLEEALTQYFLDREPYIAGVSAGKRKDTVTKAAVYGVVQDVINAYSGVFSEASVQLTGGTDITVRYLGIGEKAKLGTLTYTIVS